MKLNKVLPLVVALSLMFGISACKNNDDSNKWGDSAKIIGTVGKENIYDTELKFYYNMNKDQKESEEDIDKISDEEKEQYWETNKDKKQALIDKTYEDLVNLKIMLKLARDKGVKLEEEDMAIIDYNVSSFIKAKADEDKELAEELMKQMYGISIDEYKLIHKDYLTAYYKYASPEIEKIDVSDKEIEDKFNENKDDFRKINVRNILLYTIDIENNEPYEEDVIAEKRTLAQDVYNRVKAGESIEELAKQYSDNPELKNLGGEETLRKGETVPKVDEWLFSAKEGDVEIIETSYGIHIIRIEKIIEPTLGDEERNKITMDIKNKKFGEKLEKEKAKYAIEFNQEVIDSLDLF